MVVLFYGTILGTQVLRLQPRSKPRSPAQHTERSKDYLDMFDGGKVLSGAVRGGNT